MEENRKYKISELATSNSSQYSKNEKWSIVRYLDTGSITNNIIEEMQTIRMGVDEFPSRARRKVKRGDIIYSTVRPNQKHFGYIENPAENMLVSTGFTVLSVNEDVADSKYLYYWLSQQSIIDYLHAVGEQAVSAYPSIKAKDIEDLEIILPPLFEQRHISSILTCIDSKIELNRRINDNLEQQAQALFKSWFVDFEPFKDGNFVDSELGMIPEGWRIGLFTEILSIKSGGTPKTDILEYWGDKIPFFTPKDVASTYCMETEKHISYKGLYNCNSLLYPINTTFITARGTVGKICLAGKEMAMNQSCYALVAKELYNNLFVYLSARLLIRKICTKANGAVFSAITVRDFDESIIIPDCSTLKDFNQKVSTIYNLIHGNNLETE